MTTLNIDTNPRLSEAPLVIATLILGSSGFCMGAATNNLVGSVTCNYIVPNATNVDCIEVGAAAAAWGVVFFLVLAGGYVVICLANKYRVAFVAAKSVLPTIM